MGNKNSLPFDQKDSIWENFGHLLAKIAPQSDLFLYLHLFQSFYQSTSKAEQKDYCLKYLLNEKVNFLVFIILLESI